MPSVPGVCFSLDDMMARGVDPPFFTLRAVRYRYSNARLVLSRLMIYPDLFRGFSQAWYRYSKIQRYVTVITLD